MQKIEFECKSISEEKCIYLWGLLLGTGRMQLKAEGRKDVLCTLQSPPSPAVSTIKAAAIPVRLQSIIMDTSGMLKNTSGEFEMLLFMIVSDSQPTKLPAIIIIKNISLA